MVTRHISMRGEVIDMNRLRDVNADIPALGNASLNARGDLIGKGGIVLKTQEQIEAEWEANRRAREESVRPTDIKSENMVAPVQAAQSMQAQQPKKQLLVDDQGFEPQVGPEPLAAPKPTPSRRKIIESDE